MDVFDGREEISKGIVKILAGKEHCFISHPEQDWGVDATVNFLAKRKSAQGHRFFLGQQRIDLQLKSSIWDERHITQDGSYAFDLDVKNYNDLVIRQQEYFIPLCLLVFLFESRSPELKNSELTLNLPVRSYLWMPSKDDKFSKNVRSKRIFLRKKVNFRETIFKEIIRESKFEGAVI